MPRPDLVVVLAIVAASSAPLLAAPAEREGTGGGGLFDAGEFGNRREPITVTSDTLEYDYKKNVVVYRGEVQAIQGQVKVRSDRLTVTLEGSGEEKESGGMPGKGGLRLRAIVAEGSVRIDNGTRWATGGRATFDQQQRTLVLTEDPKLHDGSNEVAGERVVVYLDEDRSVVEGGRRRVKAVFFPGKEGGLVPDAPGTGAAQAKGTPPAEAARAPGGGLAVP
jgi:lipopolysaccharide export system protein LptA